MYGGASCAVDRQRESVKKNEKSRPNREEFSARLKPVAQLTWFSAYDFRVVSFSVEIKKHTQAVKDIKSKPGVKSVDLIQQVLHQK